MSRPAQSAAFATVLSFFLSNCALPARTTSMPAPATRPGSDGGGGSTDTPNMPVCDSPSLGPPAEEGFAFGPGFDPPAISGGTLAVLEDGWLGAADSDRDLLWLVKTDVTPPLIWPVAFARGEEPGRVVAGPPGRAFVALRRGNTVAEVDTVAGAVVARHTACASPRGIAWVADTTTLAVACGSGTLAELKFKVTPFKVTSQGLELLSTRRRFISDDLRDVVPVGATLYVSTFRSAQLFLVDEQTWSQVPVLNQDIDMRRGVGWRMVASPGGVTMSHQWSSTAVVEHFADAGCGEDPGYGGVTADAIVQTGLTQLNDQGTKEFLFTGTPLPVDVAIGPNETAAIVTPGGSIAIFDGKFQSVLRLDGEPVSAVYQGSTLAVFSREPATLTLVTATLPPRTVALTTASVFSTGHEMFHHVTRSGLSCASCHPEATDDGRVWNFPDGQRRTPSLRGGVGLTAPFHWAGDERDFSALMDDVLVRRMGGTHQGVARTKALEAWLDAQPSRPAPDDLDAAAVARGKTLFDSTVVGCSGCHAGPQGTNNGWASVGTGQTLQVPRLADLNARAPYFHDGRIGRLEDRFAPNAGGDLHGHVSQLTDAERTDLVAYLHSL